MMANSKKTNWTIATENGGIVLVGSTITASGKIDTLLHGDLAPVAERHFVFGDGRISLG